MAVDGIRARVPPAVARDVGAMLVALATGVVFVVAVKDLDPRRMSDLGLASILPPAAIVALLAVNLSFALCLRRSDVAPSSCWCTSWCSC